MSIQEKLQEYTKIQLTEVSFRKTPIIPGTGKPEYYLTIKYYCPVCGYVKDVGNTVVDANKFTWNGNNFRINCLGRHGPHIIVGDMHDITMFIEEMVQGTIHVSLDEDEDDDTKFTFGGRKFSFKAMD